MIQLKLRKNLAWLAKDGQITPLESKVSQEEIEAFMRIPREHFTSHPMKYEEDYICGCFTVDACNKPPKDAIKLTQRFFYTPHYVEPGCDHSAKFYFLRSIS